MKNDTNVPVTKQGRLLQALRKGQQLTENQISSKFDIANPRATISDLRRAGYTITTVRTTTKSGTSTTKYTLCV